MKRMMGAVLALIVCMGFSASPARGAGEEAVMHPAYLRCEYKVNPLGIDERQPRLSWIVESEKRAQAQTAYQVLAATSEEALKADKGDLWDSGKVTSDETTAIVYGGKPLAAHQRVYWKVRVWGVDGKESPWSRPAMWSMGLLDPADWKAEWIGYDKERPQVPAESRSGQKVGGNDRQDAQLFLAPVPHLRTTFKVEKPVKHAALHFSALGLADMRLNGKAVNAEFFAPGWTDYAKRAYYKTYDVTGMIKQGENALGALLADGWYSGYIGWGRLRNHYGDKPRLRAQLHIEYADGTAQEIASGPEWKAATGAIREADFLMGESYDARKALKGWDEAGFDASKWEAVATGAQMNPEMQAHPGVPVLPFEEIKPVKLTEPKPGLWTFDLGKNFAGVARLKTRGKAGQQITLRFAERLNPDGTVYTANLRGARATDTYTCSGEGEETWTPRFTFHGFQYVEVTGLEQKPAMDAVLGLALSSATPDAGEFECSDPMLNQLVKNINTTQRANYIDIPTDCPQRDERLGWTGDAQVYVRTATLNTDVQAFFAKWLVDLQDAQLPDGEFPCVAPAKVAPTGGGPAWADAGVICPWEIYQTYGDRRVLERHYESMKKFIAFNEQRCQPGPIPPKQFHAFGDWLSIKADTPKDVIFMAYFAHSARLTGRIAETLGKAEEAKKYQALYEAIRQSFQKNYVQPDGRIKGDTQAVYVLAITNDLLTPEQAKQAAQYLVEDIRKRDWHLSTGFIGTKDLMLTLARIGRNDVAYRLLHNETFPSWGFSIRQGATSIWERWDGWTPDKGFQDVGMNSFAHYSFGAVYQWMVENIGGIRPDALAYKKIVIAPQIGGKLTSAATSYRSIRGTIATQWKRENGKLTLKVRIPANATATIILPTENAGAVTESGKPLEKAEGMKAGEKKDGCVTLEAGSGNYEFVITGPLREAGMAGEA